MKELLTEDEVKEQASSEDSAVEDAIDDYAETRAQVRLQGQIVQDKVAEINALRAQLDQAKSLLNLAQVWSYIWLTFLPYPLIADRCFTKAHFWGIRYREEKSQLTHLRTTL